MESNWGEAEVEALKSLWGTMSGTAISKAIVARTGKKFTRSAIIAKAQRLGIKKHPTAKPFKNPKNRPLEYARVTQCRWPMWDKPDEKKVFCCRNIKRGSYCEEHANRAYKKVSAL